MNYLQPRIYFRPPAVSCLLILCFACWPAFGQDTETVSNTPNDLTKFKSLLQDFCLDCHSKGSPEGDLDLASTLTDLESNIQSSNNEIWERVARRIRARQMPPADAEMPDDATRTTALAILESALDRHSASHPRPGRTEAVRRLNRTEYQNAVRDLLSVNLDVKDLIPADQSGHGFDNVTVGELPPLLLSRYVTAAEKISRIAVGRIREAPDGLTLRLPADRTQESHVAGLPLGTRGGTVFEHQFPTSGEYEIQIRLMRDRDEKIEGLHEPHSVDVLIDRALAHRFEVEPPPKREGWALDYTMTDKHLVKRIQVVAGPHQVGVTFPKKAYSLSENRRKPFDVNFNRHRHPRKTPAVYEVSIVGPFEAIENESYTNTPSRRALFAGLLDDVTSEELRQPDFASSQAEQILSRVLRLAYRRSIDRDDLKVPMSFFQERFAEAGFEAGIETALTTILINPHFLFRVEKEDPSNADKGNFEITDTELASRLSFFLWSSIPDEELLRLAEAGELRKASVLEQQVSRMLQDEKALSLVNNFAAQWLYLRNLDSFQPDKRSFPNFDDNLRKAMRKETELLFAQVLSDDLPIFQLIQPEAAFLNERLAKHYGISHVLGSQFRAVPVAETDNRGGLLRNASILAVTSYATRTSPTVRGNWILENILGTPAPPPPPNVPALKEKSTLESLTVRERLAEHRANPACASCHNLMDPIGFALENYDAVGRWRFLDSEQPIDSAGTMPDGTLIASVADLEERILAQPELFAATLTEKLLTFGLGRGIEPYDGPAVRKIVRRAAHEDYRISSIVTGIALSVPFRMKSLPVGFDKESKRIAISSPADSTE